MPQIQLFVSRVLAIIGLLILSLSGVHATTVQQQKTFRDCPACPEMITIPPGRFRMGSTRLGLYERPVHEVEIKYSFAVGKYEVTFKEWDACVADSGCTHRPRDEGWGRGQRPVIHVSWHGIATQHLPWLRAKTNRRYRLLTESEWEYVARAGSRSFFSWGNAVGSANANCNGCGSAWDNKMTAPVGSFRANLFGLYDLHGNVWEWVADCWHNSYYGAPSDGAKWTTDCEMDDFFQHANLRIVRGGAWYDYPRRLRSARRYAIDALFSNGNHIGFRVALTLP
jgi:formylglycine-generating enzyme required for sulfatase activity